MATGEHPTAPDAEKATAPLSPPAATGVQATEPERIPLPPLPPSPPAGPDPLLKRIRVLDAFLVVLLLAFAFLIASFRAGNSDLFLHLATGRLIANGAFSFGKDPFTFTAQGVWVNHNWLGDLAAYFLYQIPAVGGVLLVVVKALLVTAIGCMVLQAGSLPGRSRWIPAVCTLLALLAASTRFTLQPLVLSCVLLAATMLLLRMGSASRTVWLLPVLCAAWINLDEWYFLGPLTIGLFLLGEWVQQRTDPSAALNARSLRVYGLVLLASIAACLLNPYHIRGFTLPTPLDPRLLMDAATQKQFPFTFMSPLNPSYFHPYRGLSVAGLTYFLLVLLGVVSFVLTYPRPGKGGTDAPGWRWHRVLIWLGFLLLSLWTVRAIPFFAIVSASITSLNFLDFAARLAPEVFLDPVWRRWAISGRAFTLFLLVALGAACVPGFLQAQPYHARCLGWGVDVNQGLKGAAQRVAKWRADGSITGEERWYNNSYDVLSYFAWFCADERGRPMVRTFIDLRLALYGSAIEDYWTVQRSLSGEDVRERPPGEDPPPPAWRKVLADREVRFLAFHTPAVMLSPTVDRLYGNPDEWQTCYLEGQTTLFAWRDPKQGTPFDPRLAVDFDRLAFGADAVPAPDTRGRTPGSQPWWWELIELEKPATTAASTTAQHLTRFDAMRGLYTRNARKRWLASLGCLQVGAACAPGGPIVGGALPLLRFNVTYAVMQRGGSAPRKILWASGVWLDQYLSTLDQGPVSSLYLALRAARRAVRENPEDARSHLLLAEVAIRLARHTRERSLVANHFSPAEMIRQSQTISALRTVLDLRPEPELAQSANLLLTEAFSSPQHANRGIPQSGSRPRLWSGFSSPQYLEPCVAAYREYIRLSKSLGRLINVPPAGFATEIQNHEKILDALEQQLKHMQNQYENSAARKPLLEKVRIALGNGLADTALSLLLTAFKNDPATLEDRRNPRERPGATLIVHLFLGLGQLENAREVLTPASGSQKVDKPGFGTLPGMLPAYELLKTQLDAASGDYEDADQTLGEAIDMIRRNQGLHFVLRRMGVIPETYRPGKELDPSEFAALLAGNILLRNASQAGTPWQMLYAPPVWPLVLGSGSKYLTDQLSSLSDLWTLRTWLALEQGRIDRADEYARKAIQLSDIGSGGPGLRQFVQYRSTPLARLCLNLLARPKRSALRQSRENAVQSQGKSVR